MYKLRLCTGMCALVLFLMPNFGGAQQPANPVKRDTMLTKTKNGSLVKRATFTSGILEREPVDTLDTLTTDIEKIFFFTELVGMKGETITHRWIFGGETIADVPFLVGGPRWRVYSSKNLIPEWVGTWKVAVLDEQGNRLDERSFAYVAHAQ